MKKITITGTKGKTTVGNILSFVLNKVEPKVLSVNTNGAYINGKMIITKAQSQLMWDIVPTVSPGRFLYLLHNRNPSTSSQLNHDNVEGLAVLEASLGCGTVSGLGYYSHNIGVFTNVYEDHLGSRPDLNNRVDIGKSKNFIFTRITDGGYAVFNADDDVVCDNLNSCKESVIKLPFGLNFKYFNLDKHLEKGGFAITVIDNHIAILSKGGQKKLLNISDIVWTFDGKYLPSIYNLMSIVGVLFGYGNGEILPAFIDALRESRMDPCDGRLVMLKNKKGVTIIADYAHEKQSLKNIARLAHELKSSKKNKVIGVLRLSWDRTDDLIIETANYIADLYDYFVIYDKIDGFWRQPSSRFRTSQRLFTQETGKISKIFTEALIKKCGSKNVKNILREDQAIEEATKIAKAGDVVVIIVNDNIQRSINFIKDSFKAELL